MRHPVAVNLVALADPARRTDAARALARSLGVGEVVLLVRDPEVGVLLPAAGTPQTLAAGPRWRSFLCECLAPGRHAGAIDLPPGALRPAVAMADGEVAVVLAGGTPDEAGMAELAHLFPLLSALLQAECRASVAAAEARVAQGAALHARSLARALERARADASRLVATLREEHERKDEFLAMLAHELRNPLAPIATAVDVLRHPGVPETARPRLLATIGRQVVQLTRLVEDLLDISRVSRGRIELRRERLDLRTVLRSAVEASAPLVEGRRHHLTVELPPDPLPVEGDPVRLTQVFANLLHNAAKYTDQCGRITLQAGSDGEQVEVVVRDTGIGIEPELLDRIFDLFQQAASSLDRAHGGLGIGLTLVRKLVELHGGSVRAESHGRGTGSCFIVRLALAAGAPASVPAERLAPAPLQRPLRILVVDDNRDAAATLADMLRLEGHTVDTLHAADTALVAVADTVPDLVVLDLGLPHMDGYELARRMRRLLPAHTPLVALTGYGSAQDRQRTRKAGFDGHWTKPQSREEVLAMLQLAQSAAAAGNGAEPKVVARGRD